MKRIVGIALLAALLAAVPSGCMKPESKNEGPKADPSDPHMLGPLAKGRPSPPPGARPPHSPASLAVGQVAPDIVGEDVFGKPLKLSDHRGKVVMLCFWGLWCPPCRGMIPHEREMVKRLENKPFALLGVNSDQDREQTKATFKEENITWPSWWNGNQIGEQWGVQGWPTIYLLDHKGVIRHTFVGARQVDKEVDALLKEMATGTTP